MRPVTGISGSGPGLAKGAYGALSVLAAGNGGRGAAGGADARSRNVLIAGARGQGRARTSGLRARLSAVGSRALGLGTGDPGARWAQEEGQPVHRGYLLSDWLRSSNSRRNP